MTRLHQILTETTPLPLQARQRHETDERLDKITLGSNHVSFNKEARERFLAFALAPNNLWPGNFRDLNAMVVRMATLADGGRIALSDLLGPDYADRYDDFDLVQLAHVIKICRVSDSVADAARKLYAVSFRAKTSSNSTDRLSKYLARFGLKFRDIIRTSQSPIT